MSEAEQTTLFASPFVDKTYPPPINVSTTNKIVSASNNFFTYIHLLLY